jgi:hypothetical protein
MQSQRYLECKLVQILFGEDFWIDRSLSQLDHSKIVIADVRFSNEIKKIHSMGGLVVKLDGTDVEKDTAE